MIAAQIASLVTAWQEQICASPGRAPTPARRRPSRRGDHRDRIAGQRTADQRPQHRVLRRVADEHPAEQGLRVVGDDELGVAALHRVVECHLERASVAASASPKLATSTPSSLSLVEVSAAVKLAVPPVSRSASTSAIA